MKRFSLKVPLAVAVIGAALAFSASGNWPWTRLSDVSTTSPILVTSAFRVVSDTLRNGESVSNVLDRQGVTGLNLQSLAIALSFDPKRIRSGLVFSVHRDGLTDEATHVEFRPSPDQRVQFIRTSAGWTGQSVPVRWTTDTIRLAGEIRTSLYDAFEQQASEATIDVGESHRVVDALEDIFPSINFSTDMVVGDRMAVVIERRTSEDGETRFGRVLATHVTSKLEGSDAFSYMGTNGKLAFYDPAGKPRVRSFLAAPVKFRDITSYFGARMHPILGRMRQHEGTDFAASTGSPVHVTGDGIVVSAGWSGGYGNMVEVLHPHGVTTRYGHLSRVTVRRGMSVSQGDIVGLVGMTGLATGPHLHYEFRVNGAARDFRKFTTEVGPPLSGSALASFQRERDMLLEMLGPTAKGRAIVAE